MSTKLELLELKTEANKAKYRFNWQDSYHLLEIGSSMDYATHDAAIVFENFHLKSEISDKLKYIYVRNIQNNKWERGDNVRVKIDSEMETFLNFVHERWLSDLMMSAPPTDGPNCNLLKSLLSLSETLLYHG